MDESFVMEISEDGSKVTLHHEEPILLSCEMTKYYVLEDKGGIWNKITNQERQSAVNELTRRARKRALDDDLISTATENLLERLKPLQQEYSFTTESRVLP